jgi:hypothetical protein
VKPGSFIPSQDVRSKKPLSFSALARKELAVASSRLLSVLAAI